MRRVIWVCDRCGSEIDESTVYRFLIGNGVNNAEEYSGECDRDYCKECMDAIVGFAHLPIKEVEEKPKNKKPTAASEPGPNRTELDDGMIVSLRDAGWNFTQIADEIKLRSKISVSTQTVINHYNKAKEKMQQQHKIQEAMDE